MALPVVGATMTRRFCFPIAETAKIVSNCREKLHQRVAAIAASGNK
jgi:hypothetical protein